MNKKAMAGIICALLAASVGTASAEPVRDIQKGQTVIGLGLNDYANTGLSYYAEHGLTDKIIIGVKQVRLDGDYQDGHVNSVYGEYKVNDNLHAYLGIREYEGCDDINMGPTCGWDGNVTVGFVAYQKVAKKVETFESIKYNRRETEYKAGVAYAIDSNWGIGISYNHHDFPEGDQVKGLVVGATYKF